MRCILCKKILARYLYINIIIEKTKFIESYFLQGSFNSVALHLHFYIMHFTLEYKSYNEAIKNRNPDYQP